MNKIGWSEFTLRNSRGNHEAITTLFLVVLVHLTFSFGRSLQESDYVIIMNGQIVLITPHHLL